MAKTMNPKILVTELAKLFKKSKSEPKAAAYIAQVLITAMRAEADLMPPEQKTTALDDLTVILQKIRNDQKNK